MMPKSYIRLSAGRTNMNDSTQALAFAGANSIFQGDVLLTAPNPDKNRDALLFDTLGLNSEKYLSQIMHKDLNHLWLPYTQMQNVLKPAK